MKFVNPRPAYISYGEADKSKAPDRRTNTDEPGADAASHMRRWCQEHEQ